MDCLEDPTCDDDPKAQHEPAISIAPWDPDILVAAFNDHSKKYLGPPPSQDLLGDRVIGFAISDDGGNNWKRFDHTLNPCNMSCDPDVDCFVTGSSLVVDDIGIDLSNPANPCFQWDGGQSDPATAAGGTPLGDKYLYIAGIDGSPSTEFFARLR